MKKTLKLLMAAVVMIATVSLAACSKDDDKKNSDNPTPVDHNDFAIRQGGGIVNSGDTVLNDSYKVAFFVFNQSSEAQTFSARVEKVSGPDAMNNISYCVNLCYDPLPCERIKPSFTVEANGSQELDFEYMGDEHAKALYRLTVGKGSAMENPEVVYFQLNTEQ